MSELKIEYGEQNIIEKYYVNGKLHREDGPAIEDWNDGEKYWYKQGELHKEDGPAYEDAWGNKKWYLHGVQYTENDFNKYLKKKRLEISDTLYNGNFKDVRNAKNINRDVSNLIATFVY